MCYCFFLSVLLFFTETNVDSPKSIFLSQIISCQCKEAVVNDSVSFSTYTSVSNMSMKQLQTELIQLLLLGKDNQRSIIKRLDELIIKYGMLKIQSWRNFSNRKKNTLLHELVEMELLDVVRHFLKKNKFNINIKRESDGITPFQLAIQNQNIEMCNLLKQFGADQIETEDAKNKENKMNIVWLDLEMTSLEDPEILECAVIITDKDLNELERCKSSCFIFIAKILN